MSEIGDMWRFFRDHPERFWTATKRGLRKGWYGESWEETKRYMNFAVMLATIQTTLLLLMLFS